MCETQISLKLLGILPKDWMKILSQISELMHRKKLLLLSLSPPPLKPCHPRPWKPWNIFLQYPKEKKENDTAQLGNSCLMQKKKYLYNTFWIPQESDSIHCLISLIHETRQHPVFFASNLKHQRNGIFSQYPEQAKHTLCLRN